MTVPIGPVGAGEKNHDERYAAILDAALGAHGRLQTARANHRAAWLQAARAAFFDDSVSVLVGSRVLAKWARDGNLERGGRWYRARVTAVHAVEGQARRLDVRFDQDGVVSRNLDPKWTRGLDASVCPPLAEIAVSEAELAMAGAAQRLRLYLTTLLAELRPGSFVWVKQEDLSSGLQLWRRQVRSVNHDLFPAGRVVLDDDGSTVIWTVGYDRGATVLDLRHTQLLPSPCGDARERAVLATLHSSSPLALHFHDVTPDPKMIREHSPEGNDRMLRPAAPSSPAPEMIRARSPEGDDRTLRPGAPSSSSPRPEMIGEHSPEGNHRGATSSPLLLPPPAAPILSN